MIRSILGAMASMVLGAPVYAYPVLSCEIFIHEQKWVSCGKVSLKWDIGTIEGRQGHGEGVCEAVTLHLFNYDQPNPGNNYALMISRYAGGIVYEESTQILFGDQIPASFGLMPHMPNKSLQVKCRTDGREQ